MLIPSPVLTFSLVGMVKISVHVYATLGELFESKHMELITPARTVKELVDFLSAQYNPQFKEILIDANTGAVRRSHKILVKGRDIDFLDKLDTKISDGDTISFFPPVGGG
jgi:molybdopterin synthase sulfur carrier subunit